MSHRARVGLLLTAAGFCAVSSTSLAQLRVAEWNISHYDGTDRASDIQTAVYQTFNGRSMSPDVMALQEFSTASALSTFVTVLNTAPNSPHDWAAAPFISGPDSQAVLVYRTSKITFLNAVTVALGSSASTDQPRNTYRYDLRPVGYNPLNSNFAIYSVHLKAGGTSENARQLVETTHIRLNAQGSDTNGPGTALPDGFHFIFCGDTNVYNSTQTSYQELVGLVASPNGRPAGNPPGSLGQFFDPIRTPGNWNNSGTFRFIHTQDPSGPGGMDDRHDQILLSAGLLDAVGMDYIGSLTIPWDVSILSRWDDPNHSYRCWGNDGTSFNLPLTTTGNTNVGPVIAQALKNCATTAGGHLPVFLDMRVPAKVAAPGSVVFSPALQNSAATVQVSVGNGGNVALWNAAGIASLSYTLSASAGFAAPSGVFTDAAGGGLNLHTITMDTSTPGHKTGTLTITATGADVLTVQVPLSGDVSVPCGSADFDGNGDYGTDADIEAFFACLAGDCCATCGSPDFNQDGDLGTDADIEAFFRVLSGGSC